MTWMKFSFLFFCVNMDDEVVFQNSALHQHLQSIGYTDEDVSPEDQPRESVKDDQFDQDNNSSDKFKGIFNTKVTFWTKLKSSVSKAFWDETWNDQLTQVHNKHADELTDYILQNPVLEEEDGVYIESFYTSMQSYRPDANQDASIMGVMLMQMAILSVSLAYAGFRFIYLKSPDQTSRYYIWSIDVMAVLMTIASLTPTTVKSASASRALNKLKEFSTTGQNFLKEVDSFYRLNRKAVRLIQEMELVFRGFTIITSVTPVARLEQSSLQPSRRQCPKLRRLVFHASRSLMLNVKRSAQNLLRNFPPHVEIDGIASYLANQPLQHYGPCVYISGDDMEDKLRAVTEDYSLASIKAMVDLCNIHISEFLRVLAMSCLTQAEEHDKNPSYQNQKQILQTLLTKFQEQLKPLTKLYTLHKSLTSAKEKKEKEQAEKKPTAQTPTKSLYIAVRSLSLHLQAALNRIHKVEGELESLVDSQTSSNEKDSSASDQEPSSSLLHQLTSNLAIIKSDLSACQDCVEESQTRAGKLQQERGTNAPENGPKPSTTPPKQGNPDPEVVPIPIFDMGDPIIEDQVFQAYSDDVETDMSCQDGDCLLSDEERARKKQEKREAVRVLKELKSVIAVRAIEREERERQALMRQYPDAKFEDPIIALRERQSSLSNIYDLDLGSDHSDVEEINAMDNQRTEESDMYGNRDLREFTTGTSRSANNSCAQNDPGETCFEGDTIGSGDTNVGNISMSGITHSDKGQDSLKMKLADLGGTNFPFSTELAAQAVARSQQMAASYAEETFGDDSEDFVADGDDDDAHSDLIEVDQQETDGVGTENAGEVIENEQVEAGVEDTDSDEEVSNFSQFIENIEE